MSCFEPPYSDSIMTDASSKSIKTLQEQIVAATESKAKKEGKLSESLHSCHLKFGLNCT